MATTPPATAQHPNHAAGFRPEHAFQLGDLDHVNLFNGNLTITIPIGERYPLGPRHSYGLTLTYTGNVWTWEERCEGVGECYLQSLPRRRSNAGLGWHLGFGELLAGDDPENPSGSGPMYASPDQGLHAFHSKLHPNGPAQSGSLFTQDGTYLRYRTGAKTIESPDGLVRIFTTLQGRPRLTRIEDPFGNGLDISYSNYHSASDTFLKWSLLDDHGRSHSVTLASRANGVFAAVTSVKLAGSVQSYSFTYQDTSFPRACNVPADCAGLSCNSAHAFAPLLTKLTLPDGSTFESPVASYKTDEGGSCPNGSRMLGGHLERLKLPTGGALEWDWERVGFPQRSAALRPRGVGSSLQGDYGTANPFAFSAGVSKRRRVPEGQTTELGEWEYDRELVSITNHPALGTQKVTVTHRPPGHQTVHHFGVYPGKDPTDTTTPDPPAGWTEHEYGLPFSRNQTGGGAGRFLSTQVRNKNGGLERSVYAQYERSGDTAANPRLKSQRTVYNDDGGRQGTVVMSSFDGLGHYRTTTASGTFAGQNGRTTTTNYNPGATVNDLPAATAPWVLGTYDRATITEGGQTVTREYDFRSDGFLRRQRVREGASRGAHDVVTLFEEDGSEPGFVGEVKTYGGISQNLSVNAATPLPDLSLPAQPVYHQAHTHTCGVRTKTEWMQNGSSAFSFLPLDLTVQCSTGRITTSRDIAGLSTTYTYDSLGRPKEVQTTGEAKTVYTWSLNNSNNLPARVTIERKSGSTVLTQEQIRFDDFGRVALERRLMPDGNWAERSTLWNVHGWVERRSEWEADGDSDSSLTLFGQYDPFGRPTRVTLPDGQVITIRYQGEASRTVEVSVATGLDAQNQPTFETASTTETYDRFGRLRFVDEPNGTRTQYSYDALGNLTEVRMNSTGTPIQVRTFGYDHRGFLTSESHPELGTSILYSRHDPLGNPTRIRRGGWDLGYGFDAAGRLTAIGSYGTAELWKEWEYADDNSTAGARGKGKLASATRHNRVQLPGASAYARIGVSEDYTYNGLGGRISDVKTTVEVGSVATDDRPIFDYALSYDALGNVASRSYPQCDFQHCRPSASNPSRRVTASYTRGLLTGIPGYATGLSYHPNGLLHEVTHANGVTDVQQNDPEDLQRPLSLSTQGASEDFTTGAFGYDGAGNVTQMGPSRFIYDKLSRITSADVPVVADGCTEDWDLQNNHFSGQVTLEVCGTFSLGHDVSVTPTGDVTIRAGDRVVLGDGFRVDSGGSFTAVVDPSIEPTSAPDEATWEGEYDLFGNLVDITTQAPGQSAVNRTPLASTTTNRLSTNALYDLSGNLTARAGWSYDHDPFNMLRGADSNQGEHYIFLYGPGDERIWTVDWTGGVAPSGWVETWTLRDLDGSPLRQWRSAGGNAAGNWSFEADHVWRGGGLLAAVTPQGTRHFHLDHLGTPRIVTDASGTTLAYHAYYPYGEEVTSVTDSVVKLQYTGHERDDLDKGADWTGDLDYMHARFFSPHAGQILEPRSRWAAMHLAPQSWNRYSYVLGNPMKYIDPYGLEPLGLGVGSEPLPIPTGAFLSYPAASSTSSASGASCAICPSSRRAPWRGSQQRLPARTVRPQALIRVKIVEHFLGHSLGGDRGYRPDQLTGSVPLWPLPGIAGVGARRV